MNKITATARPWKVITDTDKRHMNFPIMCQDGHLIGSTNWGAFYDKETAQANASIIVKAVNNHDLLVEACREALPCCINGSEQALGHAIKILEQALNATQR